VAPVITMSRVLLKPLKEKYDVEEEGLEINIDGIPVCGGNLETPVIDIASYIDEIRYRIGDKLYIENAD
jgi:hypothetical protein